jgi:hypothetical protein
MANSCVKKNSDQLLQGLKKSSFAARIDTTNEPKEEVFAPLKKHRFFVVFDSRINIFTMSHNVYYV